MTTEIRPPRPDEAKQYSFISAYSFDSDRSEETLARDMKEWPLDRCLAAVDDGTIVAGLRVWDLTMHINGAPVRLGGVADVACLPEHRRKGYVGKLLAASLEKQRAEGHVISGLGTPFPALYRKYGWEYAQQALRFQFVPKETRLLRQPATGAARRVGPDEWQALDAVYRRYLPERNGCIERDEAWWRERALKGWGGASTDIALWEEHGQPAGYLVYQTRMERSAGVPWPRSIIWVGDFVALTPDAFNGLLAFLLAHDRALRTDILAPPDFPLAAAVKDPARLTVEASEPLMFRLVDFRAAVQARPALPPANDAAFSVRIIDQHAPWNDGVWRIEAAEGRVACEPASGGADFECDVRDFAPIYAGYRTPRALALAGALTVRRPEALAAAERCFAATSPPFTPDHW